jgi:hypothetical protein
MVTVENPDPYREAQTPLYEDKPSQEILMSKTRTLTRDDRYKVVWSTPMRKLATEFGGSDVGLGCSSTGGGA